jgi:protein-S-isoprenylcysteine O-methyltransferase Ste14
MPFDSKRTLDSVLMNQIGANGVNVLTITHAVLRFAWKANMVNLDLLDHVIRLLWMLIMTVWLALAFESNEPVETKRDRSSDVAVWIVSIGWVLLLLRRFDGPQLIPRMLLIRIVGFGLTVVGLVFAVVARLYLGSSWDAYITLKVRHRLVRTGPYAIVRHPIYSGFILALLGSALNFGHLRSFIAATMVTLSWIYKSRLEEVFMKDHFGMEYDQYCYEVKRLIPKIW